MAITLAAYAAELVLAAFDRPAPTITVLHEPDAPIERTVSGRAWKCASGDHRFHRDERVARRCSWRVMPMASIHWEQINSGYGEVTD